MRNLFLVVFTVCGLLLSCQSPVNRDLIQIDSLLTRHPDSSLIALNRIEQENVFSKTERAYFALLKSAALDKNYIDETDDSLINIAVDYYSHVAHVNAYDKMRSYYYQGIVRKNAHNYPSAIISFEKAEQEASALKNYHYLGLIHRNMGNVFTATNNNNEAIKHTRRAVRAFLKNNDTLYANYAKYSLAVNYLQEGHHWDSCRLLLNEVRRLNGLKTLHNQASLRLAYSYVAKRDSLEKAIELYQNYPRSLFWITDYGYYALAFAFTGQKDSAAKWMSIGYQSSSNSKDSAKLNSLLFRIDSLNNNYQSSLRKVSNAMTVQDSVTRVLLQQSLTIAQKDYYQHENALQKEHLQKQRIAFTTGCVILLLFFFGLSLFMQNRKRKEESALKEQMAQLALAQQEMRKGYGSLVGAMFMEKISRLCGLSNQYYTTGDTEKKIEYLSQFKKAAEDINRTPEFFTEIEKDLDQYCSGIMSKLSAQVPTIKGKNRQIIALCFAGIPDPVIQVILNRVSTGSLRTLRSRLRQAILDADAPDKDLFLNMLEIKKQPGKK